MLEDVPQLRSYIDTRLRRGVQVKEDAQLLNGNGTAPNMTGFLNRSGLATTIVAGGSPGDNNADAILKQVAAISSASEFEADGIVMHPSDWTSMQLVKDADDNYLGTGPFRAPQRRSLWGLPVATTAAIAQGTALVGAFRTAAQLFRKGGIRVDVSNSHSDYFVRNLTAIRAEERLALAVYVPGAFGKVTLS
jgi:HK97 family phage major capsid protein